MRILQFGLAVTMSLLVLVGLLVRQAKVAYPQPESGPCQGSNQHRAGAVQRLERGRRPRRRQDQGTCTARARRSRRATESAWGIISSRPSERWSDRRVRCRPRTSRRSWRQSRLAKDYAPSDIPELEKSLEERIAKPDQAFSFADSLNEFASVFESGLVRVSGSGLIAGVNAPPGGDGLIPTKIPCQGDIEIEGKFTLDPAATAGAALRPCPERR